MAARMTALSRRKIFGWLAGLAGTVGTGAAQASEPVLRPIQQAAIIKAEEAQETSA